MSEKRSGKSHVTAWTLSLLAIPVLYVLTFPFVDSLGMRYGIGSPPGRVATPKWLIAYRQPIRWAGQFEWFKKPLDWYADWLIDRFNL